MRIPIRMIGIATTFFWVFLIAFAATAAYSAKDLQFSFGEPATSLTGDNKLLLSLPITVLNKGYYNVDFLRIATEISDVEGVLITNSSTLIPIVRIGETQTAIHNMTVDINDLLNKTQNLLFNDTELRIKAAIGMRLAQAIPVQASANLSVPWGAPLYNFTLGEPQLVSSSLSNVRVSVPTSFENHAFFDVIGDAQIRVYNSAGMFVGEGFVPLDVPQHSSYNGDLAFYVDMAGMTRNGHLEISVQTPMFSYGPMVIPYG